MNQGRNTTNHRPSLGTGRQRAAALLLIAALAFGSLLAAARPARAAVTFTVNQTDDFGDFDPGDGVCDAARFAAGRQCTLRAAIQQANTGPDRDTIAFNISGPGVKTIRPGAALPTITQPVLIDGYTQPGAKRNTLPTGGTNAVLRIELDGSTAGDFAVGLRIEAPNTVIRGLAINRFGDAGIAVAGPRGQNNRIEGCFVGTNAAGTIDLGNRQDGVIVLRPTAATIGGSSLGARNLISGNDQGGVDLFTAGNLVTGNLIGTDKTGAAALGNGAGGVELLDSNNTIGGNSEAEANTIAFNGGEGVAVFGDSVGNRILRNAIFANARLGIDLNDDGPTPNDPGDGDVGPNNLQNKPVLTSAGVVDGATKVHGSLHSAPHATFVVRVFANPPGGDEGKEFKGQVSVTTNGSGDATFAFVPLWPIKTGWTVTATATSAGGSTSEFSAPRTVGRTTGP